MIATLCEWKFHLQCKHKIWHLTIKTLIKSCYWWRSRSCQWVELKYQACTTLHSKLHTTWQYIDFSFNKRISSKSWYDILNDISKKVAGLKIKKSTQTVNSLRERIILPTAYSTSQVISNLVKKANWDHVLARNANLV